jgi:hypothetical protein
MHSRPRLGMEMGCQLHALAALVARQEPSVVKKLHGSQSSWRQSGCREKIPAAIRDSNPCCLARKDKNV